MAAYSTIWIQRDMTLSPRQRGFHLITREVLENLPELKKIDIGLLHIFIKHTSASLTLNENADSNVRKDFESIFSTIVPESTDYLHDDEGPDDMPAHVKSSLLGSSVSLPVNTGKLHCGTWQGIYLCEHRDYGGSRHLVLTLQGQINSDYIKGS